MILLGNTNTRLIFLCAVLVCGTPFLGYAQDSSADEAQPSPIEETTDTSGLIIKNAGTGLSVFQGQTPSQRSIEVHDVYTVQYIGEKRLIGSVPFTDGRSQKAVVVFPIPPEAGRVREMRGMDEKFYGPVTGGVGVAAPLGPGEEATYHFKYHLPVEITEFARFYKYPALRVSIAVDKSIARNVEIEGLDDQGEDQIEGAGLFHIYTGAQLPAGSEIIFKPHHIGLVVLVAHLVVLAVLLAILGFGIKVTLRRRRMILAAAQEAGLETGIEGAPKSGGQSASLHSAPPRSPMQPATTGKKARKGKRGRAETSEVSQAAERIARLDIEFENGEIIASDYEKERARLKRELSAAYKRQSK